MPITPLASCEIREHFAAPYHLSRVWTGLLSPAYDYMDMKLDRKEPLTKAPILHAPLLA